MRISDWSSDVCSSDLPVGAEYRIAAEERHHDERERRQPGPPQQHGKGRTLRHRMILNHRDSRIKLYLWRFVLLQAGPATNSAPLNRPKRSEERRVGKEDVSTCSSRWEPSH